MSFTRREVLGAPALLGLWRKTDRGSLAVSSTIRFPLGHRLRDHASVRSAQAAIRVPIVIVGGGMAGLNAAWHLDKRGFRDFVLLEMEQRAGGNSRWGENEISKFPWAAHYVPVPAKGESLARELFEELGVLRDGEWDERVLCFDPQERLFINGHWQEGIEPEDGATPRDREQYRRFQGMINEFRATGEFTIPMDRGAKPSPLDRHVDGRLARASRLRFAASALVHQLRVPRRLRRAGAETRRHGPASNTLRRASRRRKVR